MKSHGGSDIVRESVRPKLKGELNLVKGSVQQGVEKNRGILKQRVPK